MRSDEFFWFARERHSIHLARKMYEQGLSADEVWTADPILNAYKFTNVFRELDKTTAWFRHTIRNRVDMYQDERILLATIAFRWFNSIKTGTILHGVDPETRSTFSTDLFMSWNSEYAERRLRRFGPPYVSPAYIIKTPTGMDKLAGVLKCIDNCADPLTLSERLYFRMKGNTLQEAHRVLMDMPFMGPFMAYEVVSDLRHTHMLSGAPDILSWANPGPGALRGLRRLHGIPYDDTTSYPKAQAQDDMRCLLEMSWVDSNWPKRWDQWEMREVEHTLCEWDKYQRALKNEGRPKQRFTYEA